VQEHLQTVVDGGTTAYAGYAPSSIEYLTQWRRGAVVRSVRRMNQVNARRARLVPGWVTVFGRVHHLGMQPTN